MSRMTSVLLALLAACGAKPDVSGRDGGPPPEDTAPTDTPTDSEPPTDSAPPADTGAPPDADGDGVGDALDRCPGYDDAADLDADGAPDACDDADSDGVPDAGEVLVTGTDPLSYDGGCEPWSSVSAGLWGVAAGDVDADGDVDLVGGAGGISWAQNLGALAFGAPTLLWSGEYGHGYPIGATGAAVGDIDGDGLPDLVAALGRAPLVWLPGLGGGAFGQLAMISQALQTDGIPDLWLGDLDADGDVDLLSTADDAGGVRLYPNVGGVLGPAVVLVPGGPAQLAVGDVDGDGDLDVAWSLGDAVGGPVDPPAIGWLEQTAPAVFAMHRLPAPLHTVRRVQLDQAERCFVGTDPTVSDTDGGGTADGVELKLGRDPFDPLDD
jgi:hypothetical protein